VARALERVADARAEQLVVLDQENAHVGARIPRRRPSYNGRRRAVSAQETSREAP
jgi:hypothetical protein